MLVSSLCYRRIRNHRQNGSIRCCPRRCRQPGQVRQVPGRVLAYPFQEHARSRRCLDWYAPAKGLHLLGRRQGAQAGHSFPTIRWWYRSSIAGQAVQVHQGCVRGGLGRYLAGNGEGNGESVQDERGRERRPARYPRGESYNQLTTPLFQVDGLKSPFDTS